MVSKRHGDAFVRRMKQYIPHLCVQDVASVMVVEVGQLNRFTFLHDLSGGCNGSDEALKGYVKSELMDVLAQSYLLCNLMGESFDEMLLMGFEKTVQRVNGKEARA